jgi:Carboxypeptidase regulatory-like domain
LTLITPQGRQVARAAADAEGGYSLVAGTVAAAGNCFPAAGLTDAQGMVVHAYGDIGLAAGTRLSGVVVTIDGTRPVPGARITLLDDTGAVAAAADTDQAGQYMIEGLADGEYTAIISGYPPTASALHITRRAGTVRHDIWLGHARADHHSSISRSINEADRDGCRHHGIWGLAPDHSRASAYSSACGATACALTSHMVQSCADSAGHSRGAQCRHRYRSPRLCTRYAARTAGPHRSHVSFI